MKYIELFSGIGGFRKAAEYLTNDTNVKFKCMGFSEIDKHALNTYCNNYILNGELRMGNIIEFVENKMQLNSMPNFDLLLGGFPCQSFSLLGKKLGLDDERGKILFSIDKLLKVKSPDFIVLENVRNIVSHNNGNTLIEILKFFKKHNYKYTNYIILNSQDFGLPQKRARVFFVCCKKNLNFSLTDKLVSENFQNINKHSLKVYNSVLDILNKRVDKKYYLSDRIKHTILANGSGNFRSNSQIDLHIARTLTATMVKMHRACQDNYYSDDFIINGISHIVTPKKELLKKPIRKLTPSEALKLQGFDDNFYKNAIESGVSEHQLYKQAGNALSVNTGYALLHYLFVQLKIQNK